MKNSFLRLSVICLLAFSMSGCTFIFKKGQRSDASKIQQLQSEVDRLNYDYQSKFDGLNSELSQLETTNASLEARKRQLEQEAAELQRKTQNLEQAANKLERTADELDTAKRELESRLRREIGDNEVKVERLQRGLVITFVAEVLFDSGKAVVKSASAQTLDKVARVLNTTVKDHNIGIEGHTDNVPITKSNWKSNWELSSHRALNVLHELVNKHNVDPVRLSATGHGEYRPVASNSTASGRQQNRRVEIVILPNIEKKGR